MSTALELKLPDVGGATCGHVHKGDMELVVCTAKAYGFRLQPEDEELCWVPKQHLLGIDAESVDKVTAISVTRWMAWRKGWGKRPPRAPRGSPITWRQAHTIDTDDMHENYNGMFQGAERWL